MDNKLKITTFNCQGFKERMYDYVNEVFMQSDLLLLQETWLYNFEHSNFNKFIPNCQYYAVSSMDEAELQRRGRPFGGCAILWKRNLNLEITPVNSTSPRICAVEVKSNIFKVMLITVYMPNDNDLNNDLYGDVLSEISSIICNYEHDIIISGDLNVDFTRTNSQNLELLKQFSNIEELECVTLNITHNNFTREDNLGSRSFIDHVIINKNVSYSELKVLYNGNNLSDHNPVTIETHHIVSQTKNNVIKYRVTDWEKATEEDIMNYKIQLGNLLEYYQLPSCIINCNNLFCEMHDNIIIEKVDEILEIMTVAAELTIPTKIVTNEPRGIPGWNEYVRPYKDRSIFCHELWVSAGKPPSGQLFNDRKFARYKYHWAIKQVRKNKDNIILNKTAQQLTNKSFNEFYKTIKRLKGNNNIIATVIDNKCTEEEIADNFRSIYNNLYNSIQDDGLDSTKQKVNDLINTRCKANVCDQNCHRVSPDTIKNAIDCLNNGKNDETYNMFTDHFINANELAYEKLSLLITVMLKHGTASELINKSIIKPIPKNKNNSLSDSKNYRAISKNSIISKLLDHVLIKIIGEKLNTSDYQFAYKAGLSTSLCSFLVAETISYYRTRKSNVYMLSLDATKAFDRVQYSKLFNKLIDKEICPIIIRFIMNSYLISKASVKWNNKESKTFNINNGVKQGAVLSAPLFALYIDDLLQKLNTSKQGCHIGNLCANAFGYADDIIILSPSCTALRCLIEICEKYAKDHMIKFNPDKCTLLVFSDPNFSEKDISISISGCEIRNVKNEKHLGHTFQNAENMIDLSNVIRDIKVRTNVIINQFRPVSWQAKVKLFLSQCSSLYGCHLWNLDDNKVKELITAWNVSCRKVLGVSKQTRTYLLGPLMKSMSIENIIMQRMSSFFVNGINHSNKVVNTFFKNVLVSKSSVMYRNINIILSKLKINYKDFLLLNKESIKRQFKESSNVPDWRGKMIEELLNIRDKQLECDLNQAEVNEILKYVCIFR